MISCKQCQKHIIAYVNHELSPKLRDQVAGHLDHCETCYALYLQHRQTSYDLRRVMPLVGNYRPPSFERIWTATRRDSTRRTTNYPVRYGMAMLAITLLLLVPFALGRTNQVLAEPPTQPVAPLTRVTPNVTTPTDEGILVAFEISQTPAPANLPSTLKLDAISTP